ncbi:WD40_repeat protein [Hexamita inflata]|uniref:Cilia- and flagella-associated protein 52 n=1 Tax=Hexamita inflata TaxID=28002 RepID=A0AA86TJW7_9EUKA|nr:WD40 repeat protein [Hexamita inflata]
MNFRHLSGSSATPKTLKFGFDQKSFVKIINKTAVSQSLTNATEQTLMRGHSAAITCTATNKNLMLTGETGYDSDVLLWDTETNQILQRFSEHDGGIIAVDFSDDDLFWCSYGADGWLHIVEIASGDIVCRQAPTASNELLKLSILKFGGRISDPRGFKLALYQLIGISESGLLVKIVFNPKTALIETTVINSANIKKSVMDCEFLQTDRNLAVAVTLSGDVFMIDLTTQALICQMQLPGQISVLNCVSVLKPNQALLQQRQAQQKKNIYQTYGRMEQLDEFVAIGGQNAVCILRGQQNNWQVVKRLNLAENVIGIDSDEAGRIIFECSSGKIQLLVPPDYIQAELCSHHTKRITSMQFIGDKLVCAASEDNTLRILDLCDYNPGLVINTGFTAKTPTYPTAVCLNEVQLVTGFSNGDLKIYDVENGDLLTQIQAADRGVIASISCMRNLILLGSQTGDVRVWDLRGQKIVDQQRPHTQPVCQVQLMKDLKENPLVISSSEDRYLCATVAGVRILDFQLGGPLRAFVQINGLFFCIGGRAVDIVDLKEHKLVDHLEFQQRLMSLCARSDSELVVGCDDGSVLRIGVNANKLSLIEAKVKVHGGSVDKISSFNGVVVSADSVGELVVWD